MSGVIIICEYPDLSVFLINLAVCTFWESDCLYLSFLRLSLLLFAEYKTEFNYVIFLHDVQGVNIVTDWYTTKH